MRPPRERTVAHLTTVDLSLRYLLLPQLEASRDMGCTVVGISADGPDVPWLEERGIRHIALGGSTRGWSVRGDVRAAWSLWRLLRTERPDVLHTHNPKPGVYGRIVGRLAGVPVVVNTVHGLYATEADPWPKRLVVYGLEAVASRFSDAELFQNPEDVDLLERLRISTADKTVVLGNGVDLARFRPGSAAERAEVRAELGMGPDDVVVGFVGRLVREKGIPELVEAYATTAGSGLRLVVIGPTDHEKADALDDAARADAEARGAIFLGHRDDVERLYRGMDIFCLPSHREGFPRAAMEASATGLPIVATDIRGCRQVVEPGVTGHLVPVANPSALAAALEDLCDPGRRATMGRAARSRAEAEFDERDVVRKVLESHDVADRRRRSRVARTKRVIDVMAASVGLVVGAPILAATAAVVRSRIGSPVLFRQQRPGRGGRPFTLVKFRTMQEAVDDGGQSLPDEDRLTSFGRFLRSTSLDELPELWNVLRGDMSLVGPRPLLMEYLDRYTPEQARRHEVRPGITGLAQVNGRNTQSWAERFGDDVAYVDTHTLTTDIAILFRTAWNVIRRDGVSDEDHATRAPFTGDSGTPAQSSDAEPG